MHTRFILLHTSHAGNVGAVARAMKVMGFDDLVLVQPRWNDVLIRPEAIERASGADDVLRRARIVTTWQDAVQDIHYLCATAMTPRDFGPPTHAPRALFAQLAAQHTAHTGAAPIRSVGLVFGSERYGMRNDDVYRCHACISIPTHPAYGSLNLGAAVQVLAYEWRMALGGFPSAADSTCPPRPPATCRADAADIDRLLTHWQHTLTALGYLNPAAPKKLIPRLRQLLYRASLRQEDIHILRGIARKIDALTTPPRP